MTTAKFEVSRKPGTSSCKIKLNGEEIQRYVQGLTIRGKAPGPFTVELDVAVFEDLQFEASDAHVCVPDRTRELLLKLGWTPPGEGS